MVLNISKIKQILGELKINLSFVIVKNSKLLEVKLVLIAKKQGIFQENVLKNNKLEVEVGEAIELVIMLALSVEKKVICQENVLIHQNKVWEEEVGQILVLTAMNQAICQENVQNLEPKEVEAEEEEIESIKVLDVKKIMEAIFGVIQKVLVAMQKISQRLMVEILGVIQKAMQRISQRLMVEILGVIQKATEEM